ncbi:MAG: hypothetical protein ACP5M7_08640 [Thermoproteota archaeon]|jgi:hypothetical protein
MKFIHQIARIDKRLEKLGEELEREKAVPEGEEEEISRVVWKYRPHYGEFITNDIKDSVERLREAREKIIEVLSERKNVKRADVSVEPNYILRGFVDFDVGTSFPASVFMTCASHSYCTLETDIPFKLKEKIRSTHDVERYRSTISAIVPDECTLHELHFHEGEREVHAHVVCTGESVDLPFIVEDLVKIGGQMPKIV